MNENRFEHLDRAEREILFEALLHCIDSNSAIGFPHSDQQHPDYHDGLAGRSLTEACDCPENNLVYQMLYELSLHVAEDPAVAGLRKHLILSWPQFCKRAIKAARIEPRRYVRLIERDGP